MIRRRYCPNVTSVGGMGLSGYSQRKVRRGLLPMRFCKITGLAVRDIIHGRKVKNVEALANQKRWNAFGIWRSVNRDAC